MGRSYGKNEEMKNCQRPESGKGKGGEEDRECDGRTALKRSGKSGRRMENNSKR